MPILLTRMTSALLPITAAAGLLLSEAGMSQSPQKDQPANPTPVSTASNPKLKTASVSQIMGFCAKMQKDDSRPLLGGSDRLYQGFSSYPFHREGSLEALESDLSRTLEYLKKTRTLRSSAPEACKNLEKNLTKALEESRKGEKALGEAIDTGYLGCIMAGYVRENGREFTLRYRNQEGHWDIMQGVKTKLLETQTHLKNTDQATQQSQKPLDLLSPLEKNSRELSLLRIPLITSQVNLRWTFQGKSPDTEQTGYRGVDQMLLALETLNVPERKPKLYVDIPKTSERKAKALRFSEPPAMMSTPNSANAAGQALLKWYNQYLYEALYPDRECKVTIDPKTDTKQIVKNGISKFHSHTLFFQKTPEVQTLTVLYGNSNPKKDDFYLVEHYLGWPDGAIYHYNEWLESGKKEIQRVNPAGQGFVLQPDSKGRWVEVHGKTPLEPVQ